MGNNNPLITVDYAPRADDRLSRSEVGRQISRHGQLQQFCKLAV
jgi:hypothetical protein